MATDLSALDHENVGITDARRNLAELVTRVRLLGQVKFLTSRDRRVAVLLSVDEYERLLTAAGERTSSD